MLRFIAKFIIAAAMIAVVALIVRTYSGFFNINADASPTAYFIGH
jgi:hypothetical protein